jgi:membrane associated rhomboid family serine protease
MIPLRDRLPRRRVPIVNYLLLATNLLAFVWERMTIAMGVHPLRFLRAWGLVPAYVTEAPFRHWPSFFTSMFLHDPTGWAHIAGNMLFLWIFGDNVEDALGRARYLAFYVLSGLAAAAAQILIDPGSEVPMVGASGAIAGVLAAYGSLYPRSPITVLNPILPLWFIFGLFLELPAWLVILQFFVVNLLSAIGALGDIGGHVGGVAFFAHLGGFVAGLLLVRLLVQDHVDRYDRWSGWRPARRARPGHADPPAPARPRRRDPWGW